MRVLRKHEVLEWLDRGESTASEAPDNPFASPAWTAHFVRQVAADDWTFLLPEAGAGVACGLLYATPARPGRIEALTNYYASLYSPIAVAPAERAADAAGAFVAEIAGRRPRANTLNLAPLDAEAPFTQEIAQALRRQGWHARSYFCFGNWYLPSRGLAYEAYLRGRPSQVQNTITRKGKKFHADAANRLEIVSTEADLEAALQAFGRVYARSWKRPEPYPDFVPGWARICAARGWLRLGLAWVGDVPVAAQFWFVYRERAYIFKLAYDEAYQASSAGTLLTAELFRRSLDEDRVTEIDYLTGDDAYKKTWMNDRRERTGLFASNLRTFAGFASAGREFAAARWQRWRGAAATA
jgi:hypothetical protein